MNPFSTCTWRLAALGWLGVVCYLTLLPFSFGDQSLADAWAWYRNLRFDGSGPRARQQWVSNLLMFVPLGFFWAGWWLHRVHALWARLAGAVLVAGFCLLVTATVEFLQFWIPNRGPSLTDISANATGGVIGVLAWLFSRLPPVRDWTLGFRGRQYSAGSWVFVYLAVYVFASLLPLDLMLSAREFSARLGSPHWGLFMAPDGCWSGARCVTFRMLEILLPIPLGMWLARCLCAQAAWRRLLWAGFAGMMLGLVVELGQFLTLSGVSEGISVLLRGAGAALGAGLWVVMREQVPWPQICGNIRMLVLLCLPLYLAWVGLLGLEGAQGWLLWQDAWAKLESMRWLPLYYHYFMAEGVAMRSVMLNLGLYALVGLGVWLWDMPGAGASGFWRAGSAGLFAAGLAALVETGKLFAVGLRPDTAAPILAMLAASVTYLVLWWGLEGEPRHQIEGG